MANTVSNISYANTFGEWVVATNGLINENNALAVGDYTKSTGTIYLNETTKTGLQANGNLVVQGSFTSQGIGSSARIQNNLTVEGQIYFSNTTLGLTNSGQANINGLLVAQGPNTSLSVANNTYMGGNTTIRYNTITNNLQANTSVNTTTASVTGGTYTNTLQANTSILTGSIQANSYVNTAVVSASATVYGNYVQANTSVITPTALVSGTTFSDILRANSYVTTPTAAVSGTTFSDVLQANTSILTGNLQANTSILTGNLQANNYVNSTILSASSIVYGNRLQANTSSNTSDAYVVNTTWTNYLQANTAVFANTSVTTNNIFANVITANSTVTTSNMVVNTKLDGNTAAAFLNSLQVQGGGLTVNGNFILTGTTIYASNTFQLSTGTSSGISSYIQVARGSSGTNAAIRWNEPSKYWDMLNVNSNTYYRVLTNEYITSLTTDTSSTNVASAAAANTLNIFTASAYATSNAAFLQANTAFTQDNAAFLQANTGFAQANAAFATANAAKTTFVGTTGSFQANTIIFSSNNGLTFGYTGANTMAVSTSQDLRTSATPNFTGLTLTNALGGPYGGTGATSLSAGFQALIYGHIGSYGSAGQVLTTNGSGTYTWGSAGGGGGSAVPGTTISSSRLSYTANGAAGYSGNTYAVPAALTSTQVRPYINGVRQFESDYSVALGASSNTISFTTTPVAGDSILIEVDGYVINPYYANNIPYSVNLNIGATANTIQLALDGLTSKLTTYYANTALTPTFTVPVLGLTMPYASGGNTAFATTAYVQGLANNSGTLTTSISGNAGTVTNGVYTSGSYADPSWITSLSASKLTLGTIPSATLGLSTVYIGSTAVALNRTTASLGLTGITSIAMPGSTSGTVTLQPTVVAGTTTITLPATTGTVVTTGDTGTVTSTMIADATIVNADISTSAAIAISKLAQIYAANVSGLATVATSGSAADLATGTLPAARLPYSMDQAVATTSNVQYNSLGIGTAASGTAGEIRATNNITAYYSSDRKFKENIQDIPNALEKVDAIGGKLYDWTDEYIQQHGGEDGYFVQKADFGVIAQDVQSVFPIATRTRTDGSLAVDYEKLCALAFAAIKELKNEVEVLKGQIK